MSVVKREGAPTRPTGPISDAAATLTGAAREAAGRHGTRAYNAVDIVADRIDLAAVEADDLYQRISGRQHTFASWALVLLSWLSLGTSLWLLFWEPASQRWLDGVRYADWALCGLLALSICWRWLRFRIGRRYLRARLWEIPALVPLAIPGWTEAHWVMWLVLLARIARMVDRTDNYFGDKIVELAIEHFSDPIVDAVRKPITVAVLDEVIDVIKTGTYAANVRAALDENRAELEAMILELLKQDHATGKLRLVPFHDDIVNTISDTVLRLVEGALDDPRTSELISDVIRNSAEQLRQGVRAR
ncbi:MAG: ion transporter [Nocardioides sp.]|uniref:ion transporter n=1 Tax=Nocardioides sp. TaxID=35761 RepID=UPI0039E2B3AD